MDVLEVFRKQYLKVSISRSRLSRLALMTLLEGECSDASKESVVKLLRDYGYSKRKAERYLAVMLERLSEIRVRPGPITLGE